MRLSRGCVFFLSAICSLLIATPCARPVAAESYRYIDDSGNIIFVDSISQIPPRYRYQVLPPTPAPEDLKSGKGKKKAKKQKPKKEKDKKKKKKPAKPPKPVKQKKQKKQNVPEAPQEIPAQSGSSGFIPPGIPPGVQIPPAGNAQGAPLPAAPAAAALPNEPPAGLDAYAADSQGQ